MLPIYRWLTSLAEDIKLNEYDFIKKWKETRFYPSNINNNEIETMSAADFFEDNSTNTEALPSIELTSDAGKASSASLYTAEPASLD